MGICFHYGVRFIPGNAVQTLYTDGDGIGLLDKPGSVRSDTAGPVSSGPDSLGSGPVTTLGDRKTGWDTNVLIVSQCAKALL